MAQQNILSSRQKRRKPSPVDVQIGQCLKLKRLERGLSQEEVGRKLGLAFQQIQKYEAGANRVSAARLHEFAIVLKCPIEFFFGDLLSKVSSEPHLERGLRRLLDDRDGMQLLQAFAAINSRQLRKAILLLVNHLGNANS